MEKSPERKIEESSSKPSNGGIEEVWYGKVSLLPEEEEKIRRRVKESFRGSKKELEAAADAAVEAEKERMREATERIRERRGAEANEALKREINKQR